MATVARLPLHSVTTSDHSAQVIVIFLNYVVAKLFWHRVVFCQKLLKCKRRDIDANANFIVGCRNWSMGLTSISSLEYTYVQVILFEIDCAIFYTNLHDLFIS